MKKSFFIALSSLILSSTLAFATPICVSNSSGGVFCYETLPPIDSTLPPLTWFVVSGGPTLPGQNVGVVAHLDHDLTVLGSGHAPETIAKEVIANEIQVYAQLISLKDMETSILKKCSITTSRSAEKELCRTWKGRNVQLDQAILDLRKGIFELVEKRPNLAIAARQLVETKNSIMRYKKIFIAGLQ